MTRRDFLLIAETIRSLGTPNYTQATAVAFALRLRASHPRFNSHRFLIACGIADHVAAELAEYVEAKKRGLSA